MCWHAPVDWCDKRHGDRLPVGAVLLFVAAGAAANAAAAHMWGQV